MEEDNIINMFIDLYNYLSSPMLSHTGIGSIGHSIPGISIKKGGFKP